MADKSAIEWTDATWNPIRARNKKTGKTGWHCEHATTGCEHCYAEGFNKRLGTRLPFKPGHRADIEIFLDEEMLTHPLRWKKARMIFVCSMTDLFADFVPDEFIDKMFAVMALSPQHTFQVLTKRASRMRKYLTVRNGMGNAAICGAINGIHSSLGNRRGALELPLPNVWLGVSAERQAEADERIPLLLETPAAVRFLSAEPLLGTIYLLQAYWGDGGGGARPILDWVIVGGESGPKARAMHPAWAQSLRDQCAAADVPFFFKQWGAFSPHYSSAYQRIAVYQDGSISSGGEQWFKLTPEQRVGAELMYRRSKEGSGRLLDLVEHNGMPEIRR